jgi:hypothetical protein
MINNTRHLFTLLTLLVVGTVSIVSTSKNVSAQLDPFPLPLQDPFEDFVEHTCIPESQSTGLTKEESIKLCSCTVKTLKNEYTSHDFYELLRRYRDRDPQAKDILTTYGQTCFEQVLGDILF